jgi:4-diphosphocytidyl-2-C-methyl-D-erythritol kinase
VPYFFQGGTALGLDRGDVVFPLVDARKAWVVLVLPLFGVSTKDAYAWLDELDDGPRKIGPYDQRNDLQPAVARRHLEIGRIVAGLRRAGASHAAMSGSGSAVFGLFSRRADALRAAAAVASQARRTVVTRTVDRSAYQALAGC